jgi:hypothetical protein
MGRRGWRLVAAIGLLAPVLVACGGDPAPHRLATGFHRDPGYTRVFERYGAPASERSPTGRAQLTRGTRTVEVHIDCVKADGPVEVRIRGLGGAGTQCRTTGGGRALVELGSAHPVAAARFAAVTVTAPPGGRWSVAIDTSTRTS